MRHNLIHATGRDEKEKEAAKQAAISRAALCLANCPHCVRVVASAPETRRSTALKIGPETCRVRTECALQPEPVRPPQAKVPDEPCHILKRAA